MPDEPVPFTTDATIPVRRMIIEMNDRTARCLNRREQYEHLNPSTLFNRAMQVYDRLMTAQELGTPITIGNETIEIK